MKNHRCSLRVAALLLALFMLVAAAPAAYATTPEQEAVLASPQRSIRNPGGAFELPQAGAKFLHPQSLDVIRLAVSNIADQLLFNDVDPQAVQRIFSYIPVVLESELPPIKAIDIAVLPFQMMWPGVKGAQFVFIETDDEDVYQLAIIYNTHMGKFFTAPQRVLYNAATGIVTGTDEWGVVLLQNIHTAMEFDIVNYLVFTPPRSWQSYMGFNVFYDMGAPLVLMYIETQRFPFVYDGRDWMIQIWKGSYGPSNGAELGIYEKPSWRPIHWDCSELELEMTMKLYQGNDKLIIDYDVHTWWIGAFKLGNPWKLPVVPADQLRYEGTITFKSEGMAEAFWASFEQNKTGPIEGRMDGLTFYFDWLAEK